MFGNRALYHEGLWARTIHKAPWERKPRRALAEDIWELYDTSSDSSLVNDLSQEHPEKLEALKTIFMQEAARNNVLPIDDRTIGSVNPALAGRPDLIAGRTSIILAGGMTGTTENVFINIKNKSKTITAQIRVPEDAANGTITAQGVRFGGWSLYVHDGVPGYDQNFLGLEPFTIAGSGKLSPGKTTIRFEFDHDGGGLGKGGDARLFVNDT